MYAPEHLFLLSSHRTTGLLSQRERSLTSRLLTSQSSRTPRPIRLRHLRRSLRSQLIIRNGHSPPELIRMFIQSARELLLGKIATLKLGVESRGDVVPSGSPSKVSSPLVLNYGFDDEFGFGGGNYRVAGAVSLR